MLQTNGIKALATRAISFGDRMFGVSGQNGSSPFSRLSGSASSSALEA
jgi:hypothetical protein